MPQGLEGIFGELGLTQYLDAFVDQGFDTWDTILDIQESDLDALGVKLGHRRKLQRKIANARGLGPSLSLVSNTKNSVDDARQEGGRTEPSRSDNRDGAGIGKRKYRRHPKRDDNAPERPPSAYVLFSNKMRDDLKNHNLTFTEIAKLVGENWQSLPPAEKEAYESQANAAKEKYHRDLMEYKKTPEYRRYAQYLQEFREKQAKQVQAHEAAKRPKIEPMRSRHGSSSSSATPNGIHSNGSGSGSGSERLRESEPPPNRRDRDMSAAPTTDPYYSNGNIPQRSSMEERPTSQMSYYDAASPMPSHKQTLHRPSSWKDGGREPSHQHLPSLSDMFDDGKRSRNIVAPPEPYAPGGFVAANHRRVPASAQASRMPPGQAPMLRHEQSSNDSTGSTSSGSSVFSRSSGDGSLPIHALLSDRAAGHRNGYESSPATSCVASPTEPTKPSFSSGPRGYGFQSASSAFQHMKMEKSGDGDVLMTSASDESQSDDKHRGSKNNFDGMSALLRAGEIVGRHTRN